MTDMPNMSACVGGDGGPLIVLQASAVNQWQGASDFDNSLMGGGDIETDYDVVCAYDTGGVTTRYDREILVLWDSEFGAALLSPVSLAFSADTIVLTHCMSPEDLPEILPRIVARVQRGQLEHLLPFSIKDTMLRLQVGADNAEPSYTYNYVDIPVSPGVRQCEVYLVEHHDSLVDEVVVIRTVNTN